MPATQRNVVCLGLKALLLEVGGGACACAAELPPPDDGGDTWTLAGAYTVDLLRNAHGGLATGDAWLDNLDLALDVDGERAFGVPGLRLFLNGLYNNAERFSERYPGDVMVASNIDGPQALRLYEAWADVTFAGGAASLRVGLYDLNSEFDASNARSLFINSTFGVGHELGQTGENGPSIFPSTSLAARLALTLSPDWTFMTAIFDGVPAAPGGSPRERLHIGGNDGALVIAELQHVGTDVARLAMGAWYYTKEFELIDDQTLDVNPARTARSAGAYALADIPVWSDSGDSGRKLDSFARMGIASDAVNAFGASAQFGAILRQPFTADAEESLGIAVTTAQTSTAWRHAQRELGGRPAHAETAIELTYRRAILPWLTVQPDIQYIFDPGADGSLEDALVLGLRIELSTERAW